MRISKLWVVVVLAVILSLPGASMVAAAADTPAVEKAKQARLPVPDTEAVRNAIKTVTEVYKDDFAKVKRVEDKSLLAQKLYQAGVETSNDGAGQFALFSSARTLAIEATNVDLAIIATEAMARTYDLDLLAFELEALTKITKVQPGQLIRKRVLINLNFLLDEAIASDRYDLARPAADLATEAAMGLQPYLSQSMTRAKEVREIEGAFAEAKAAGEVLAKSPTDPAANTTVGKFKAMYKGEWAGGLPLLALSNDAELKPLAEDDLKAPQQADAQAALADRWWAYAEKSSGVVKRQAQLHAANWYTEAAPKLTGLPKAKAEKRILELAPVGDSSQRPPRSSTIDPATGKPIVSVEPALSPAMSVRFIRATLGESKFLDYLNNTWRNDIRSHFEFETIENGSVRVAINDTGGYEHKLIVFPMNARTQTLKANITIERGSIIFAYRTSGLAPRGYNAGRPIGPSRCTVEIGIVKGQRIIKVNNINVDLEGDPADMELVAFAPSRNCSFVIHSLVIE